VRRIHFIILVGHKQPLRHCEAVVSGIGARIGQEYGRQAVGHSFYIILCVEPVIVLQLIEERGGNGYADRGKPGKALGVNGRFIVREIFAAYAVAR